MVDQRAHRRHRGNVIVDPAENIQQMRMELRIGAVLWLMAEIKRFFRHCDYLETAAADWRSITRSAIP